MTWGRKNGDAGNCASWPPVCTYAGMDSLINLRYNMMADDNNAILSPVGAIWKYIRQNHPLIELYQSDDSHPSVACTYAAVCVFCTVLFRKDPTTISFIPALSSADALRIRNATKSMVYDSLLNWHVSVFDPFAIFSYTISRGNQIVFSNKSLNAQHFSWDFGDGTSDTGRNPEHTFMKSGSYKVQLIAGRCGLTDTTFQTINITMPVAVNTMGQANDLRISPNPVYDVLNFHQHYTKPTAYKIINLTGQTMHSGILPPAIRQIDVSRLPAGVYMM